jgi:ABC-type transport system involved in multi-copper enzyme maturation permease subunit
MIVLPVIARELRSAARHSFTYNLRTLGVAALLLASFFFGINHGFGPTMGSKLFGSLHFTLFAAIWILVPLLTADCISRERREGTLGLLFMTKLKASDIVVAKGLAHGLRAMTLWLAVLPVVTIPFLLGGLSWGEALLSFSINFSAICCALAAGLLASAWSRAWLRALLMAAILSIIFLFTLATAVGLLWTNMLSPRGAGAMWVSMPGGVMPMLPGGWIEREDFIFLTGLGVITNAAGNWFTYLRLSSTSQVVWAMGEATMLSVLALLVAILAAGARTRLIWQEEPPSARQLWWQKTFCTPVFWLSFFRRWMRHKLENNPIGWLHQRTWSGRLVTWGWFAVVVSLYSAVITDRNFFQGGNKSQSVMAWLLAGSMALSAAGSFRRERESGVLELLLVSPLAEIEIISGRLRGLWAQFLPAFGALLGLWAYFLTFDLHSRNDAGLIFFYAVTFLTLPVIGLYFSLCCRNFISAFSLTLVVGMLAPIAAPATLGFVWYIVNGGAPTSLFLSPEIRASGFPALFQIVFALHCWTSLRNRLKNRAFPLERTET